MQTLVSHYFCTYALDQDLRFKNKNLKIDFGPFLVFFTQTHFSIQEPPWTFANYYFFFQWQQYKNVIPFLYVGQHLANKKIENKHLLKKGVWGNPEEVIEKKIACFFQNFHPYLKKISEKVFFISFDIWNEKYIFWGQNTLKMQGNHVVRIALTFSPIFCSIYLKMFVLMSSIWLILHIWSLG